MAETPEPTPEQIKALTSFLPRLYAEGFSPIENWEGGDRQANGSISMPYPTYHGLVKEFFGLVSSQGWLDTGYRPEQAYEMLKDESRVKTASLGEIRAMLTYCLRGERFSDGHWGQMIEHGYIRRLLERLKAFEGPARA